MAMKKQKERKSGSRMHRVPLRERLYENWRNFIVQLYGNGGLVPTLDWRGCIGIDLVPFQATPTRTWHAREPICDSSPRREYGQPRYALLRP